MDLGLKPSPGPCVYLHLSVILSRIIELWNILSWEGPSRIITYIFRTCLDHFPVIWGCSV